ncbi:MAG: hypothetical protein WBX19_07620 [Terracidiphilus sp.]
MTDVASDMIHDEMPELVADKEIAKFLQMYAHRQFSLVVLTPLLMQLRCPVIGKMSLERFIYGTA